MALMGAALASPIGCLRAALHRNTVPEQDVRSEVVYFMSTVSKVIRRAFLGIIYMSACAAGPERPGLDHFFKVNDHVYRGAQPSSTGWTTLAKMGVRTVVDLRREGEDGEHSTVAERKAVDGAGMRYINIPMKGSAPTDAQISSTLGLLGSGETVFVHCRRGKDRTGTVIACYRISHDGWTSGQALSEAISLGLHRIKFGMQRYIQRFRRP